VTQRGATQSTPNSTSALMAMTAQELRQLVYEGDSIVPSTCHILIKSLPGNKYCVDCGREHPDIASVNNGVLICSQCAAKHDILGKRSRVKTMKNDLWSVEDILFMLEGGNTQLYNFFRRHKLVPKDPPRRVSSHKDGVDDASTVGTASTGKISTSMLVSRYKTRTAKYYRDELGKHIQGIIKSGLYQGRRLGFENEWRLRVAADNGTLGLSEEVIRKAMKNYQDPNETMMSPEELADDNERLREELIRTRRNLEVRDCEIRILKGNAGRSEENISVMSEMSGRDHLTRTSSTSSIVSKTKRAFGGIFGRRNNGRNGDDSSINNHFSNRGRNKRSGNGSGRDAQSNAETLQVAVREEKAGRLRSLIHEQEIKSILFKTDYDLLEKQLAHNEVLFGEISAVLSRVEARQVSVDAENKKLRSRIETRMAQRATHIGIVNKLRKKLNYHTIIPKNSDSELNPVSLTTDGTLECADSDEFSYLCNRSQNLEIQRLRGLITATRTVKRHDLLPPGRKTYPTPPINAELTDIDILRRKLQEQTKLCELRKADCDFMEKNLVQQNEFTQRLTDVLTQVEDRQKKLDAGNDRLKSELHRLELQMSSLEDEIRHLRAKKVNDDGVFAVVYEYMLLD